MHFGDDSSHDSEPSGLTTSGRSKRLNWRRTVAGMAAIACLACVARPLQQDPLPTPDKTSETRRPAGANEQAPVREVQTQTQTLSPVRESREKQLVDDSAKLLKLATALKAEVDKTTIDTLSLAVIRRADEIEKLAHSVKKKIEDTGHASK